ncbi:TetR/AcrR family transcriptional regulator [Thermodesulfobacteriota bacterium]
MPENNTATTDQKAARADKRPSSADEKRRLIMESAEALFASRGFLRTTISDVSEHSGVHEASIFQYFKTKENLLVSIPERHLSKTLESIAEHFQGMKGAESKLRKLIWHQLRDLSLNKNYSSILLLELRTLPAFYKSSAYQMIRKYSKFGAEAIREGIADGEVDPEVQPILVLEMAFGAIDSVVLRWLFFDETYDPNAVADRVFSLVKAAIWKTQGNEGPENGDEPTRGEIKRRLILKAASEVFGKKGYSGATISEIAGRAGIAEASIYQYFKGKEHLLLSVPGTWFDGLADELERVFAGGLDPCERLRHLLRRWQLDFLTKEWDARILILELYRNREFYNSQSYKSTHRFWNVVRTIMDEGRRSGVFRDDFDTDDYLHLVQGTFDHEALARMMLKKRTTSVQDTEKMIDLLIRAITP